MPLLACLAMIVVAISWLAPISAAEVVAQLDVSQEQLEPAAAGKPTNAVVFLVDDLGYGDLSCFGRKNISSVHVDQLAKEGIKFTQWISAASICTPSRAALQTGRLPVRFGVVANALPFRVFPVTWSTGGIPDEERTIGQVLQGAGYRTGMSGKWHLGISSKDDEYHYLPPQKGYDSWLGVPYTNMHKCKERPKDGEGRFWCMLMGNNTILQQPLVEEEVTARLTDHAIKFITHAAHDKVPFFFLFAFMHVHTPLFTAPAFRNVSRGGEFGDNLEEMDHAVGRVMATIGELGLDDSTLVFFTSDNGPFAEEGYDYAGRTGGLKGSKGQTYEGGIRMPGIARWPSRIPAGVTIDKPVSTMDIFPTVLSAAGLPVPAGLDGADLLPLLEAPTTRPSPHEYMFHYCGKNLAAVRQIWADGTVIKYHLLTPKWNNKGNLTLCDQCCPNGIFNFGGNGGSLCDCQIGINLKEHTSQPVMYDMGRDPKETTPLTAATFPGGDMDGKVREMFAAVDEHRRGVKQDRAALRVKNQLLGMKLTNLPCCNGKFWRDTCQCNDRPYP